MWVMAIWEYVQGSIRGHLRKHWIFKVDSDFRKRDSTNLSVSFSTSFPNMSVDLNSNYGRFITNSSPRGELQCLISKILWNQFKLLKIHCLHFHASSSSAWLDTLPLRSSTKQLLASLLQMLSKENAEMNTKKNYFPWQAVSSEIWIRELEKFV